MVLTFKFASTFDCNNIFALFNNADGCVIAPRITAALWAGGVGAPGSAAAALCALPEAGLPPFGAVGLPERDHPGPGRVGRVGPVGLTPRARGSRTDCR